MAKTKNFEEATLKNYQQLPLPLNNRRMRNTHGDESRLMAWLAAYEAWENDSDQANDAIHRLRIAAAAIEAQLPFYADGETDFAPEAWMHWAIQRR